MDSGRLGRFYRKQRMPAVYVPYPSGRYLGAEVAEGYLPFYRFHSPSLCTMP